MNIFIKQKQTYRYPNKLAKGETRRTGINQELGMNIHTHTHTHTQSVYKVDNSHVIYLIHM